MSKYQAIEKNVRQVLGVCRDAYNTLSDGEYPEGSDWYKDDPEIVAEIARLAIWAMDNGYVFVVPKQISLAWRESNSKFKCRFQDDFRLPYSSTIYLSCDTETGAIDEALFAHEIQFNDDEPWEPMNGKKVILSHAFENIKVTDRKVKYAMQGGFCFLDVNRQVSLVPACEAMMKSKSSITADAHALPSKLRKKRLKTDPTAYTSGFTLVGVPSTISQSEANDDPYPVSAHFRRGHWKHRKTGTYWWDACVVGKGEVKERVGYIGK